MIYGCVCAACGTRATELHHIIFRGQNKQLENCKLNFVFLCHKCHRGTNGVHGTKGHKLDLKFKKHFQDKLDLLFVKEFLEIKEIKLTLKIDEKAVNRLLKTVQIKEGKYFREDVIRACMGGKMIVEDKG